jgi:serine protease Do
MAARRRSAFADLVVLIALVGVLAPTAFAARDDEYRARRRDAVVQAVEKAGPSIVNISTETIVSNPYYERPSSFMDWFLGRRRPQSRVENSLGSGVIVDREGYVLTNEHVIGSADRIIVTLRDERQVEAELVGSDRTSDVAVLKLKGEGPWPAIDIGRSDDLMIGETVVAIGNPFGFENTVTLGVVSAIGREITRRDGEGFADFIQTDAAINPGNSGGALLDINGELIGINTQIVARAQNLGFAIPIDRARRVLEELRTFGRVRAAWTGLVVEELDGSIRRALGIDVDEGVLVVRRYGGSPASDADIRANDVIVAIDGTTIESLAEYQTVLANVGKGTSVRVDLLRGERALERTLRVEVFPRDVAERLSWELLGVDVRDGERGGAFVARVRPDSWLGRRGLSPGWRVLRIQRTEVENADTFYEAIENVIHLRDANLRLTDGRRVFNVSVPLR